MSRIQLLKNVVDGLHSLADDIQAIADALAGDETVAAEEAAPPAPEKPQLTDLLGEAVVTFLRQYRPHFLKRELRLFRSGRSSFFRCGCFISGKSIGDCLNVVREAVQSVNYVFQQLDSTHRRHLLPQAP